MARYIDLDNLLLEIGLEDNEENREINLGEIVTLEDIDRVHIEDVRPIVHAKYKFQYYEESVRMDILKCTNCDDEFGVDENKQGDFYCPYCGAIISKE